MIRDFPGKSNDYVIRELTFQQYLNKKLYIYLNKNITYKRKLKLKYLWKLNFVTS